MAEWEMAVERLVGEMRIGFGQVVSEVQQTNVRLDQTNERLDKTNERLDRTNERLEQTNERLDRTNEQLNDFQLSVNSKLDGIGSYLKLIDHNFCRSGNATDQDRASN